MQSVLILYWFICEVCLFFTVLYATCPYYLLLYMQNVQEEQDCASAVDLAVADMDNSSKSLLLRMISPASYLD